MYWNFRSLLIDFLISIPLLIVTFTFICVGSSALTADVYLVSAPETLVIMVNVSDSSLYGEWQLSTTRSNSFIGSYTIRITVISDLDFTYTLYRLNPEAALGFVSFEGNPREGDSRSGNICSTCFSGLPFAKLRRGGM